MIYYANNRDKLSAHGIYQNVTIQLTMNQLVKINLVC